MEQSGPTCPKRQEQRAFPFETEQAPLLEHVEGEHVVATNSSQWTPVTSAGQEQLWPPRVLMH